MPAGKVVAHRDDVGRRDDRRVGGRIAGDIEDRRPAGLVRGQEEAEGATATAGTVEFDESEVVAVGEDADPLGRDAGAAGGARDTVGNGAEAIAGIHRRQV